jgi:hypothetical protein
MLRFSNSDPLITTPFPKPASPSKIKKIIDELRQADLKNLDINYLTKQIELLGTGYHHTMVEQFTPITLYRAVTWNEKPQNIKALSYPPSHKAGFGRANFPGDPKFYCSGNPKAPFFELNLKPGDKVAFASWYTATNIILAPLGYTSEVFCELNSNRKTPQVIEQRDKHPNTLKPRNKAVSNFFSEEFTKRVSDDEKYSYKISAIISQSFSNESTPDCAIVYPSVAMHANAENLALHPNYVDKYLRIKSVTWYLINHIENLSCTVTPLNYADSFDDTGYIQWQVTDEKQEIISVQNKEYVIQKSNGEIHLVRDALLKYST